MTHLSQMNMDKHISERRRTCRYALRLRVHLYDDKTSKQQVVLLHDINFGGLYLIARLKLAINQHIEIVVPSEPDEEVRKLKAKVIRFGQHRSWGVFSYGCRILH